MNTITLYRHALLLSTICLLVLAGVVLRQEHQLTQSRIREQQTRRELQSSRDQNSEFTAAYLRAVLHAKKMEREHDALWEQQAALEHLIMEQSRKYGNRRIFFAHCPCPEGKGSCP